MPKYDNLKCIQEHCSDLALIINQLGYEEVNNWLMIAAGIRKIDFHWNRFDKTGAKEWCRPSYEYDLAKNNISQLYVNELTVFNYTWGALENLSNKIFSKNQIKKKGRVNLCLKMLANEGDLPVFDYHIIRQLFYERLTKAHNNKLIEFDKELPLEELKVIYNIRNKFAHGDMEFPQDADYNTCFIDPIDLIKLISESTRIVLCYIQSLILILSKGRLVYSFLDNLFLNIEREDYEEDLFQQILFLEDCI